MPPEDPLAPLGITAADLAPDDTRSADFDWTGLGVHFVAASCDDDFAVGYAALWDEFGDKGEMETPHRPRPPPRLAARAPDGRRLRATVRNARRPRGRASWPPSATTPPSSI